MRLSKLPLPQAYYLIYSDELDITLVLKEDLAQFLEFDTRNQTVKIRRNVPPGHGLAEYRDSSGCLDAKKFFHKFLELVRDVVREISGDAQYLADMKIEGLTTDWTPCTGKLFEIRKCFTQFLRSLHEG